MGKKRGTWPFLAGKHILVDLDGCITEFGESFIGALTPAEREDWQERVDQVEPFVGNGFRPVFADGIYAKAHKRVSGDAKFWIGLRPMLGVAEALELFAVWGARITVISEREVPANWPPFPVEEGDKCGAFWSALSVYLTGVDRGQVAFTPPPSSWMQSLSREWLHRAGIPYDHFVTATGPGGKLRSCVIEGRAFYDVVIEDESTIAAGFAEAGAYTLMPATNAWASPAGKVHQVYRPVWQNMGRKLVRQFGGELDWWKFDRELVATVPDREETEREEVTEA